MATPPLRTSTSVRQGAIWALDALAGAASRRPALDLAAAAAVNARGLAGAARLRPVGIRVPDAAASALLTGRERAADRRVAARPEQRARRRALRVRVRERRQRGGRDHVRRARGRCSRREAMLEWTGEERWAAAWQESAESVWAARDDDGPVDEPALRPRRSAASTALHGLVGIVPRAQTGSAPGAARAARPAEALRHGMAVREDGLANWPTASGRPVKLQ